MSTEGMAAQVNEIEIRYRKIILDHVRRYPKMEAQDLYKLIHQGTMGSEHAVDDPEKARAWMEEEVNNLQPGPEEPLLDPISPSGEIVRINLRPYLEAGGSHQYLLKAFIRTANEYKGSSEAILEGWTHVEEMVRLKDLEFSPEELSGFMEEMIKLEFPAVHHSEIYNQSYHPAYRVVSYSFFSGWMRTGD